MKPLSCDACGSRRKIGDVCCVYVPIERTGWCAWCGEDCGERAFCNGACAYSYAEDVVDLLAGGAPRFSSAILWSHGAYCRAPAEYRAGALLS